MSGDVQPRKRNKDKRKPNLSDIQLPQKSVKQDDDLDLEETNIHVHKDVKFGGNVVSKIFFSLVFGALICMVGVIVFEHRGMGNEVLSSSESPWSQMLEGWVEDKDSHDSHDHHVTHDDHDEEEEDDHTEDVSGEHDDHDDEHTEDLSGEDNHDDDDHNEHDDEAEDNHDQHSEEQADDTDEESSSYFTRFMQSYVQSSDGEKGNDNADEHDDDDDVNNDLEEEASVFTGFINKYIYTTESAKDREDEGYDTQDDDDNDVDDENSKEINDDEDKYREDDDDSELDNDEENNDRDDETPDDVDDDIEYKTSSRRYSFQDEKDDDENNDDDLENDDDDDVSREADNDLDSKEQVVEDWRKIVYRSPAHHEEEEDGDDEVPYESHTPARVDREEKNESEEQNGDDDDDVEARDELEDNALPDDDDDVEARDDLEDNALPDDDDDSEADVNEDDNEPAVDEQDTNAEEDEGAGIAVKFTVGVALIVVAHLVLVKKWKGDADIIAPSAPQPPLAQDPPAYIEQIPLLSSLEEEDIPPPYIPADRRATLVEPGEVVLSPSDVEESDLGEYEEEMSGSDVELEPPRESTLVTYEYSPVDTEQEEEEEEEEEKSENDISGPINDKWAALPRPTPQMDSNSENEELVDTEDEIEFSDHEPSPSPAPVPQARYGGPKSGEEDYLLADITSAQDWGIRNELDAAEAMYNGSESST